MERTYDKALRLLDGPDRELFGLDQKRREVRRPGPVEITLQRLPDGQPDPLPVTLVHSVNLPD